MQPNIESIELAEIIKFGQTGVLNEDGLSAIGSLMDQLNDRAVTIADYQEDRDCGGHSYAYADDEGVRITSSGFEVQTIESGRCGDHDQYDTQYVSFKDFLDPDIMTKIQEEIKEAKAAKIRSQAAQKAAATRKANQAAEEKAAFKRFKEWEQNNA